jgi:hypothetical protein
MNWGRGQGVVEDLQHVVIVEGGYEEVLWVKVVDCGVVPQDGVAITKSALNLGNGDWWPGAANQHKVEELLFLAHFLRPGDNTQVSVGHRSGAPRGRAAASIEDGAARDDRLEGSDSSLGGAQIERGIPSPSSIGHDIPLAVEEMKGIA